MVRACCVSKCPAAYNDPCHSFPKNDDRRKRWFHILNMKSIEDEKEIKKLKICYRHFRDNDYSSSSNRRILLHFAVPSVNLLQHESELVNNVDGNEHRQQEQVQNMLHEHSRLLQEKMRKNFTNMTSNYNSSKKY